MTSQTVPILPFVAFDEAGNTGQYLTDPAQPVFALASVHMDPSDAAALIDTIAPQPGQELHFKKLRRRPAGQRRILEILNSDLVTSDRVKVVAYHKSFMVTAKIVDVLVEELAYRNGVDLYARSRNLGLANMWHAVIPSFCGQDALPRLHERFVRMVRSKTPESIEGFYTLVEELRRITVHAPFRADLGMLLATRQVVDDAIDAMEITLLDPAIPAFVELVSDWTEELEAPFEIVHDQSKPIAHERELLELLMAPDEPRVTLGNGRRTGTFPLAATGIRFGDSMMFPELQLADVVASATAYAWSTKVKGTVDDFARAIAGTRLGEVDMHMMWPTYAVTPEELGAHDTAGVNFVDYVTELLHRQRQGRRGGAD